MTLHVHTARITSRDPDRLDITRKGNDPLGVAFAPSWALLNMALAARKQFDEMMSIARGDSEVAGYAGDEAFMLWEEAWSSYREKFFDEMRVSYRTHRSSWDALLARDRVVLRCFCDLKRYPGKCHRLLVGADILPRLDAVYEGEVTR